MLHLCRCCVQWTSSLTMIATQACPYRSPNPLQVPSPPQDSTPLEGRVSKGSSKGLQTGTRVGPSHLGSTCKTCSRVDLIRSSMLGNNSTRAGSRRCSMSSTHSTASTYSTHSRASSRRVGMNVMSIIVTSLSRHSYPL